ncbi:MAG: GNAT family N-acetyltransferase, partial [Citrobacter sp.]
IIDGEWPQCDAVLQRWLAADNFDENGQQRRSLAEFATRSLHKV